jgi:hypothetical protein
MKSRRILALLGTLTVLAYLPAWPEQQEAPCENLGRAEKANPADFP